MVQGVVPNDLREENITALFKKGSTISNQNYRPVSYEVDAETVNYFKARLDKFHHKYKFINLMPRIFKHLEADCLQVNLLSISAQINQL